MKENPKCYVVNTIFFAHLSVIDRYFLMFFSHNDRRIFLCLEIVASVFIC